MVIPKDGRDLPAGPFDAVLVDVPCSNTGVLNRRPEARWRFNQVGLEELVVLQTRLLLQACELVRPGGRVVYSTCSMEPEENRGVVDTVLMALKEFRLDREIQHPRDNPPTGLISAADSIWHLTRLIVEKFATTRLFRIAFLRP